MAASTRHSTADRDSGFTLAEVLMALALTVTLATGIATLFAVAVRTSALARHETTMTMAAVQRMEQLRALTWGFDSVGAGGRYSDTTTDLSVEPPGSGGGGLQPSPPGSLDRDVAGYVDYLDRAGRWVAGGSAPPPAALYVRRWQIRPAGTADTLIIDVVVTTAAHARALAAGGVARRPVWPVAAITTVKTRRPG
jgi:prepilin-type N-terminal cleavage/methylation domain-containing protein